MQSNATPRIARLCLIALCVAVFATAVPLVNINSVGGNAIGVIPNVTAVTGSMMAGMKVEATYADGSASGDATWKATGVGTGMVTVPGWFSLTMSGDTFGGIWTLTNLNDRAGLTDLHLCGADAGIFFDRTQPSPGTFDTASGWDWQWVSDTSQGAVRVIDVIYMDLVGNPALGDTYGKMDIISIARPLGFGQQMEFIADTDKFVPEPGTYQLIACGLAGILVYRLRRK